MKWEGVGSTFLMKGHDNNYENLYEKRKTYL